MRRLGRRLALAAWIGTHASLGAALAATTACAPASDAPAQGLVWIVLDAACADHLASFGGARVTTPQIDALAAESLVFEHAYAQWPSTLMSASSYLTGLYPSWEPGGGSRHETTLAEHLAATGIRTAGFSENPFVSRRFGLARGFETFFEAEPIRPEKSPLIDLARRDSHDTTDRAIRWLRGQPDSRFFLYLHLLPPHAPYTPPAPFAGAFRTRGAVSVDGRVEPLMEVFRGERALRAGEAEALVELYHENLLYADAQVGRVLEALEETGRARETIVVVSSDHGEAFGEHGRIFHGTQLYEEQVHVPLILRLPGEPHAGVRVARPVELVDLAPTLAALLGAPLPERHGDDLVAVARGSDPGPARAWLADAAGRRVAVVRGALKLLIEEPAGPRERKVALFDLEHDPHEHASLAAARPEIVDELADAADPSLERRVALPRPVLDAGERARLEALGYVAGDGARRTRKGP